MRKQIASFRSSDWKNLAIASGASAPFGYFAGRPVLMVSTMFFATGVGAVGGFCMGLQQSFGRLTGFLPNDQEVARASSASAAAASSEQELS